ncbi:hypothetical protein HanPI659440_Chr16g0628031 [Helianthus annuus]|nr:hypothetical protein HanPI659440_Chr16g0628031 [Helianthus annuus]
MSSLSSSGGENPENIDAGGVLPVLNWSEIAFQTLLLNYRMPAEYGAPYPAESETVAYAPSGYVTRFADFFHEGNFWLSLTVFMADLLEYYRIHISQLSPPEMVRARHFKYCFWSKRIEPTIEHFHCFYQLQVQLGFYSFFAHKGVKKILEWKPSSKQKPVCREDDRVVGLWRMFTSDNKLRIAAEPCDDGEEGWYETIVGNFRIPEKPALEASVAARPGMLCSLPFFEPLGCAGGLVGCLAALGAHPAAAGGSKAQKAKRQEKAAALVTKRASTGIFRPRKTQPTDYVLVSDTLEGLDILGATFGHWCCRGKYRGPDCKEEKVGGRSCWYAVEEACSSLSKGDKSRCARGATAF